METFLIAVVLIGALVVGAWRGLMSAPPAPNPALRCPHCDVRGQVTAETVTRKQGISGGKATGALMTGGVSMLATGLSRKQGVTHMRCGNCGTGWDVA